MSILPKPLTSLIEEFSRLPGVGPRTAERYAIGVLKSDATRARQLARALDELHGSIATCPHTFMIISGEQEASPLYTNPDRDKSQVAVVEDSLDVVALEKTGQYSGTYHVLGGALSPIDGIGPEQLTLDSLLKRIEADNVTEIIIATNASVEGESTALYLQKHLAEKKLRITRLARGLPAGIDLEYADQITLTRALEGRQAV